MAVDGENPMTMADVVQTGVTHATATSLMHDAYQDWNQMPQIEHSWNRWKIHFNDAFDKIKALNAITADIFGYGIHNINTTQQITTYVSYA